MPLKAIYYICDYYPLIGTLNTYFIWPNYEGKLYFVSPPDSVETENIANKRESRPLGGLLLPTLFRPCLVPNIGRPMSYVIVWCKALVTMVRGQSFAPSSVLASLGSWPISYVIIWCKAWYRRWTFGMGFRVGVGCLVLRRSGECGDRNGSKWLYDAALEQNAQLQTQHKS